jgi:hypothetical protein
MWEPSKLLIGKRMVQASKKWVNSFERIMPVRSPSKVGLFPKLSVNSRMKWPEAADGGLEKPDESLFRAEQVSSLTAVTARQGAPPAVKHLEEVARLARPNEHALRKKENKVRGRSATDMPGTASAT